MALCTITIWSSLGLLPNYVVSILGSEGSNPHHMQGCHTQGLGIGLKEMVILNLNIYQTFDFG